jgi:membrane protein YdbS with pleckstrin-like domain
MKSSTVKRLGVLIVVVGAPVVHYALPGAFWIRTSAAIAAGLMMIFFSQEPINDERVQNLKLKAVNAAFSVSFTLTLIINWLLNREFDITRDFNGATGNWRSISAFDLIVLSMVIALALFHYWRFQDSHSTDSLRPLADARKASP